MYRVVKTKKKKIKIENRRFLFYSLVIISNKKIIYLQTFTRNC